MFQFVGSRARLVVVEVNVGVSRPRVLGVGRFGGLGWGEGAGAGWALKAAGASRTELKLRPYRARGGEGVD
jgi:hypothetical protein